MLRNDLRLARHQAGWSQYETARRLEISRSFYGMIECGRRNPTLLLARRMAQLYGVDLEALFFGGGAPVGDRARA